MKKHIQAWLLLLPVLLSASDIDALLGSMALSEDLSKQTVKENDGSVVVFKRQDLDRMHIRSFAELMERIPYIRYNETALGLTDPLFAPYQPTLTQYIRVYVNDRELLAPYNGDGLQVFSQMDMGYIDHVEVYLGMTSYLVSRESAFTTIKLYTKNGARENTSLVGVMGGSNATGEAYLSRGEEGNDYSYFAYADVRQVGRKTLYHEGHALSREKTGGNFYGQITLPHWRFEAQAAIGKSDLFMGSSWEITPDDPTVDYRNLYAGAFFENGGLKASLNYANSLSTAIDRSATSPLGVVPAATPPYYMPYYDYRQKLNEHLVDAWIRNTWKAGGWSLSAGAQNRFKRFRFESLQFDGIESPLPSSYDTENIASLFSEVTYLLNASNLFSISGSIDYYAENGGLEDRMLPSVRGGYIFNREAWMVKLYAFYAKMQPQSSILYAADAMSPGIGTVEPIEALSYSAQLQYRHRRFMTELLLGYNTIEDLIVYNLRNYSNNSDLITLSTATLRLRVPLGAEDKFEVSGWTVLQDNGASAPQRHTNRYGAEAALFKRLGKFDTYNMLSYRSGYDDVPVGWNYHVTLSYEVTRKLQLYLKGENPFGTALKTNYFRVDPLQQTTTTLEHVEVYERSVMAGLELQF